MDALKIIGGLLVIGAIIFGYIAIWGAINEHCSKKFDYEPLGLGSVITCAIAGVVVFAGFSIASSNSSGAIPQVGWNDAFMHSNACNGLIVVILGLLIEIGLFIFLWSKTSFLSAIPAIIMLMIASATVVFIVIAVIALIFASANDSRKKVYVVDE